MFYFIDHLKNNFNFSYRKRLKLPCHLTEYEPSSPIHNSNFTANEKKKKKRGEQKNKTTIINLQFCGTVFVLPQYTKSDTFTSEVKPHQRAILIVFAIETMRWPKELTRAINKLQATSVQREWPVYYLFRHSVNGFKPIFFFFSSFLHTASVFPLRLSKSIVRRNVTHKYLWERSVYFGGSSTYFCYTKTMCTRIHKHIHFHDDFFPIWIFDRKRDGIMASVLAQDLMEASA